MSPLSALLFLFGSGIDPVLGAQALPPLEVGTATAVSAPAGLCITGTFEGNDGTTAVTITMAGASPGTLTYGDKTIDITATCTLGEPGAVDIYEGDKHIGHAYDKGNSTIHVYLYKNSPAGAKTKIVMTFKTGK